MTISAIPVFVGPSLPPGDRPTSGFEWRPPASAGDILALVERPPARLCLIDGFFDSRPAPWHKELLQVMARGTLVFGAASMGALRAAELHRFGMIGVGAIFRAYRDGLLLGDDEVALIHADERLRWVPLTIPMVEVRATLIAACRACIVTPAIARRIRSLIHHIHFHDRDWPMMERACVAERLVDEVTFRRLQSLHVELKRHDARACLAAALGAQAPARAPIKPPQT
ncbi:MAG TPA: TfuA domain-containing protein, partial [Allosphingosinicella sp.]|nr:TfuA domain-containing protein [Allosphingosinicella sp.]